MSTMDALNSYANAQKDFAKTNKKLRDDVDSAANDLGAKNADRISTGRTSEMRNDAQLRSSTAERDSNRWESSIGLASAAVKFGAAAANSENRASNMSQALMQAVNAMPSPATAMPT